MREQKTAKARRRCLVNPPPYIMDGRYQKYLQDISHYLGILGSLVPFGHSIIMQFRWFGCIGILARLLQVLGRTKVKTLPHNSANKGRIDPNDAVNYFNLG